MNIINGQAHLRSKKELIEKFIAENMIHIADVDSVPNEFEKFGDAEKEKAYYILCEEENLDCDEVRKVVDTYIYEERIPLKDDVYKTLNYKPKYMERKKIVPRVLEKIVTFVEIFYDEGFVNAEEGQTHGSAPTEDEYLMAAEPENKYGK